MTFLKKLGQVLLKFASVAGVAAGLIPFLPQKAQAVANTALNDVDGLTQLGSAIVTVETSQQGQPGAVKLAAAIPLVGQVIKTSELVSGHKVANEALFTQAIQEYAQATVDLLNSLDSNTIQTSGQTIDVSPTAVTTTVRPVSPAPTATPAVKQ